MALLLDRRSFVRQSSAVLGAAQAGLFGRLALGADTADAIAETSYGKVRGTVSGDIKIFKGIPYGGNTGGKNRFMPPVKPALSAAICTLPMRGGDIKTGSRIDLRSLCR